MLLVSSVGQPDLAAHLEFMIVGGLIILFLVVGAARDCATMAHSQRKTQALAVSALSGQKRNYQGALPLSRPQSDQPWEEKTDETN